MAESQPGGPPGRGWPFRLLVTAGWMLLGWWGWASFGPVQLGGPAAYTIVSGSSMQPTLSAGDLVLLRRAGGYHVGEVVAYRTPGGATVLHRLTGRAGERYQFQGDNNSWVDPYLPLQSDLVGRLDGRLPGVGWAVEWLRQPLAASLVVGVVSFLVGWRYQRRQQPRPRGAVPAGALAVILAVGFAGRATPARAAPNTVPPTRLGVATFPVTADSLKPPGCVSLTLANLITGTGTVTGSEDADLILAGPGVDDLSGKGGQDCLLGGGGADTLDGVGGGDVLDGGPGNDKLGGQRGDDVLDGGAGDDALDGGSGDDVLDGGAGDDELNGGAGDDRCRGGADRLKNCEDIG